MINPSFAPMMLCAIAAGGAAGAVARYVSVIAIYKFCAALSAMLYSPVHTAPATATPAAAEKTRGALTLMPLSQHNPQSMSGVLRDFPFATLGVNIAGSMIMGALIVLFAVKWTPPHELRNALIIGFLGSYTTFSTFSLDAIVLFERGAFLQGAVYIGASVALCIGGLALGAALMRLAIA